MNGLRQIVLTMATLVILTLAGCGGGEPVAEEATSPTADITAEPTATITIPTPDPALDLDSPIVDDVFATGRVEAAQDADLVFQVNGQVSQVLVDEGQQVQTGDVLAVLDTRPFDQDVRNAEAALVTAQADELALFEDPREEEVRAAQAQIDQAVGQLNQVQGSVTEADLVAAQARVNEARATLADLQAGADDLDIAAAQNNLNAATTNLDQTRSSLSFAKTQSEVALQQAAENLRSAQVDYSSAYWDWVYVRDNGRAPPVNDGPNTGPPLSDQSEQGYRNRLNQAEIALRSAEDQVNSAKLQFEQALQNEVIGVQQAELQVRDAQIALDQVLEPADEADLASARANVASADASLAALQGLSRQGQIQSAQAGIAAAQANLDLLFSDPTESQELRADANIVRAEASLEQAQLNREYAEIRAPFDGEVATINIDPGDPGITSAASGPAIRLVDLTDLFVEVDVTDADIARVQLGQQAEIVADALPDDVFEGRVVFIAPAADVSPQGVVTYRVQIELEGDNLPLRVGMNVTATILVAGN